MLKRFGSNLIIVLLWRTAMGLLSFIALANNGSYTSIEKTLFWPIAGLSRWDSAWYERLATLGYNSPDPNWKSADPNFAFFPLYPTLINIISRLTGLSVQLSGLVLNIICLTLALYGIEKLANTYDHKYKQKTNDSTIKILVLFAPTAVFYGMIYTEALFLCLFVWLLYGLLTSKSVPLLLAGGLLAVTRLNGILCLATALGYFAYIKRKQLQKPINLGLATLSTLPLATWFLYNYLYRGNHNPFFFLQAQKWWWQRADIHPNIVANYYHGFMESVYPLFANPAKYNGDGWALQLMKDNVMIGIAIILLLIGRTWLPKTWFYLCLATILISSFSLNFMSTSRIVLPFVPIAFVVERLARKYKLEQWVIAGAAVLFALQVILSALYSRAAV
jgi:hypothetical protein